MLCKFQKELLILKKLLLTYTVLNQFKLFLALLSLSVKGFCESITQGPLAGPHNTGDLSKRVATSDNGKDHSAQMLICNELFCISFAIVLSSCPLNAIRFHEI